MRGGGAEKKKWGVRKHGTKWEGMKDRQTNRMVQVCRGPDPEAQKPGPSKTGRER